MAYRDEADDHWRGDFEDGGYEDGGYEDDEYDGEDDDEVEPTVPCPYCREEIHEDAQRCPRCGEYISAEDRPPARQPWWIVLGAIAVMYVVYRWTVG
jgi:predicted nucleic acid-binding Zn ribbon protein